MRLRRLRLSEYPLDDLVRAREGAALCLTCCLLFSCLSVSLTAPRFVCLLELLLYLDSLHVTLILALITLSSLPVSITVTYHVYPFTHCIVISPSYSSIIDCDSSHCIEPPTFQLSSSGLHGMLF